MMKLQMAYSPCPNDTFMFHDVAAGALAESGFDVTVHLHDVETLNRRALEAAFDVTKISFHAWLHVRRDYELLNAGAALGYGNGPLLVARKPTSINDLAGCRIAVPGELTTAHLLLRLRAPEAARKVFVPYDQVAGLILNGEADCGVLIHETRFVYKQLGLVCVADLGAWWEQQTGHPIPLGCIVARRSLGPAVLARLETLLRGAIRRSIEHPERTEEYVRSHARELDPEVLRQHIRMFVNEYSLDLGEKGRAAIATLEAMARKAGIVS